MKAHAKTQRRKEHRNLGSVLIESIDDSFDAVLDQALSKIDQQPQLQIGGSQVGQLLFGGHRMKLLFGLQFNRHFAFDYEISAKAFVEGDPVPVNLNRHLPLKPKTSLVKFIGQNDFINGLQKAWAKVLMKLAGSVHNNPGSFILLHGCIPGSGHDQTQSQPLRLCALA